MTTETTDATEATELFLALGRIMRAIRRSGDAGSLSPGATSALATLVRSGPMRLSELAAAERVSPPTMSRIVAALDRDGHIGRGADPDDGRAQLLSATESGESLVGGLTSARLRRFARAMDRLDDTQRAALATAFEELEGALDED